MGATEGLIAKVEESGLTPQQKYDLLHELRVKRVQFNDALVQALGLSLRAQVAGRPETGPFARFGDGGDTFVTAVPGQTFAVQVHVVNGSDVPVKIKASKLESNAGATFESTQPQAEATIADGNANDVRINVKLPMDAKATRPPVWRPVIAHN